MLQQQMFSATHGIWCYLFEALKFMLLDLKYLIAVVESTQPQIGRSMDSMKPRVGCFLCVPKMGFVGHFQKINVFFESMEWIEAFAK